MEFLFCLIPVLIMLGVVWAMYAIKELKRSGWF